MKKLIVIALAFLVAGSVSASTMPTCGEGSHYEGSYVETETCNRVCTKKFFGMCLKYENVCTTSGSWVGGCVANAVEEPVEEPEDETGEETEEPTEEPSAVVAGGGSNAWFTLLPKIVADNYYYQDGIFHFLSSYRTEGFVEVEDSKGAIEIYEEGKEYVFHSVTLNLAPGEYKVTALTKSGNEIIKGKTISIAVK